MVLFRLGKVDYFLYLEMFVLSKGKPWSQVQVNQLRELRENGKTVIEIAQLMEKSADAVKQKLRRLGLKVVTLENTEGSTTSGRYTIEFYVMLYACTHVHRWRYPQNSPLITQQNEGNGCSFHDSDITTVFLQNSPFFSFTYDNQYLCFITVRSRK